ncbi:MAG: TAXI family TRAP transporter solute-binding subunit [Candidatus Tectomicrobia bacterium]|nr:TAXI family TRAP transporter solute-binding subunit [Candidatus Tectomicrobia bacterium]
MISWGSWLRGIAVAALMAGLAWTGAEAASTKVTIVGAGKGAGAFRQAGAIAEVVRPVAGAWLQIAILADSGIMKVEDLKGKRVSLGPKGSNTVYMLEVVFKAVGIYDSLRKDYLKWEDAATYMVDGKLDSFGIPNPIPGPALLQAAQSRPIRMLDIPEKALDAFLKISKAYYKTEADMSVYNGMQGKKIRTIANSVYVLAHDKVPAGVVYEVAKHFYDPKNRGFILNVYRPLRDGLDAAQDDKFIGVMKSFGLKLHPGAARYWKERSYNVN